MKSKRIELKVVPDWFDIHKYSAVSDFDIYDWHFNIFFRTSLTGGRDIDKLTEDSNEEFDAFRLNCITALMKKPAMRMKPEDKKVHRQDERFPIVRDLSVMEVFSLAENLGDEQQYVDGWQAYQRSISTNEGLDPASERAMEALDESANTYHAQRFSDSFAYLQIDLHAHLEDLAQAFTEWVKQEKANRNVPFQDKQKFNKPPKPTSRVDSEPHDKRRFSIVDFKRWHRYAMLPFFDLKLWAWSENVHIPDSLMVNAIFAGIAGDNDRNLRGYTKPLVREVFTQGCIDLMRNQAGIAL